MADDFYNELEEKLPDESVSTTWPVWPTLALEFDRDVIDTLDSAAGEERLDVAPSGSERGQP